jgi:2-dehydro-3-deoxyphosphogluconate aldolase / (4S)-4-hydroxy-2-oxoglutarate aldolase
MTVLPPREEILRTRLIAIVRAGSKAAALEAVDTLAAVGVAVCEISLTTPGALEALSDRAEAGPTIVGAGTVRSIEEAQRAIDAGAAFLVSPGLEPRVVEWASANGVLHIPGVFTPSEVAAALGAGASLLKLFPAGRLGSGYVRDLLAPFPDAQLIPTGGIDEANAREFLAAGSVAVAIGSALLSPENLRDRSRLKQALKRLGLGGSEPI